MSALGTFLRELIGVPSRLVDAIPEDPFILEPHRVSEKREWEAGRDRRLSHNPVLIDAQHPPTHAGLLISLPDSNVHLGSVSRITADGTGSRSRRITADDLLAEDRHMGAPVYLNSTFGPGVRITGVVVPQVQDADGSARQLSTCDAEWADRFVADSGLSLVTVPGTATTQVEIVQTRTGWQATIAPNQYGEGGDYPLTGDNAFRSIETEYATGLLMHPFQVAMTLESMKTAGVSDGELRDIAAHYEQVVTDNERLWVETRASTVDPQRTEVTRIKVRDQDWAGHSYGRYEQENEITPEYARLSRVQGDRWDPLVEAMSPHRIVELIERAKVEYPHLAEQLDAMGKAVSYSNAAEWQAEHVLRPALSPTTGQVTGTGNNALKAATSALVGPGNAATDGPADPVRGADPAEQSRVVRPTRDVPRSAQGQGQ